jgi:phosphoribosylformimino-5-aminoimidazole carboxamide ribotide isomerase
MIERATAELFPAIDLRAGQVVRLLQGDYGRQTTYGDDPVAVALAFAEQGATWIHVVDLDAARSGSPVNRPVVAAVAATVRGVARVQTGGGVRTVDDARELARAGVARVVMGSAAVRSPELVGQVADVVPVAVGLDHRGGELAVHGWTEGSGVQLVDALQSFAGAAAFVITDIARDGMLEGPDLAGLAAAAAAAPAPVIASGGVSSLDDVTALARVPGIAGVITGKALYEGLFTVAQAVAALSHESGERRR